MDREIMTVATLPTHLWIDVRSPQEYAAGHIKGAVSLPLFSDEERALVGTTYVQQGRNPAITQGLSLIGSRMHLFAGEVEQWTQGERERPLMLYCARGGMRSQSMAWLLRLYGYHVETYPGGYKGYKSQLPLLCERMSFVLLEGATGVGKTELLTTLTRRGEQVIDLEGIAHHRGSAFGYHVEGEQPSNEAIALSLIEQLSQYDPARVVWIESESKKVGARDVPDPLFAAMRTAPRIEVTATVEERLDRIVAEYGELPDEMLMEAFDKIARRVGEKQARTAQALVKQGRLREAAAIALAYYDKAYSRSGQALWEGPRWTTLPHLSSDTEGCVSLLVTAARRGRLNLS